MKTKILVLAFLLACAACAAQTTVLPHTTVFPHTTLLGGSLVHTFTFVDMSTTAAISAGAGACSEASTTVTCLTATTPVNGLSVTIYGMTPTGYNGNYIVTGVTAGVSFTYTTGAGLGNSSVSGNWYQGPVNNNCTASTSTCTVTLPSSTTAGALLIAFVATGNVGNFRYLSNVSCEGTFAPLDGSIGVMDTTRGTVDIAYLTHATGGCGSFTFTLSGNSTTVWTAGLMEATYTGSGYASVDGACAAADDTPAATSQAGIGFSLTGSSDFIVQQIHKSVGAIAINESYTMPADFNILGPANPSSNSYWAVAYLQNSTTGTAPTWTIASSLAAVDGCAFK